MRISFLNLWLVYPNQLSGGHRVEPRWHARWASVTQSIGLMATAFTSYNDPYNIARYFASQDHLSDGRVSWSIVTSWLDEEAANFGATGVAKHSDRYARATEFITVVKRLWDSWEDEALLFDKASGAFADPEKVHIINHVGESFKVRGTLNIPRPPQRYPVLAQRDHPRLEKTSQPRMLTFISACSNP